MTLEKLFKSLEKITNIYNKLYSDKNTTPFETHICFFSDGSGRVMLDCYDSEIRERSKLPFFEGEHTLFNFHDLNDFQDQILDWSVSLAMKVF